MAGTSHLRASARFARWPVPLAAVFALTLAGACSNTPTTPTPPPIVTPPPPPGPPTVACPAPIEVTAVTIPAAVNFAAPTAEGGQAPVTVACAPAPDSAFRVGTTDVECLATDSLNRTAACTFSVTVRKAPQLSRTRFLAFGDSITSGEVTVPIGSSTALGGPSFTLVQVLSAAYPTVLQKQLAAWYSTQHDSIVVANYGQGGEKAINARNRFIQALNAVQPQAVLLMEGSNDIALGENGAASGAASEIRNMAIEARLRGIRVFIATVPPGRPGGSKTIPTPFLVDYNNRMRVVALSEGAELVDVYQALVVNVNAYIGVDGLHPNEAGYGRIADTFFSAIANALEIR